MGGRGTLQYAAGVFNLPFCSVTAAMRDRTLFCLLQLSVHLDDQYLRFRQFSLFSFASSVIDG